MAANAGQPLIQEGCVMQELIINNIAAIFALTMIFGSIFPTIVKHDRGIRSAEAKIAMLEDRLSELEDDD